MRHFNNIINPPETFCIRSDLKPACYFFVSESLKRKITLKCIKKYLYSSLIKPINFIKPFSFVFEPIPYSTLLHQYLLIRTPKINAHPAVIIRNLQNKAVVLLGVCPPRARQRTFPIIYLNTSVSGAVDGPQRRAKIAERRF